ncbi:lamin tail domain-containing protein [Bacillus horti]|uniref:Lamin tail domain-containing protein n=2 Tax=Caldalkalibacillus horti TaxID=77523 RepID=A0ABT9VZI0_9BACI|nr:lamin tail domain-containing protein [Bacillus horti]MDQ0166404.1 hypothetical protein [Bacillus horti]
MIRSNRSVALLLTLLLVLQAFFSFSVGTATTLHAGQELYSIREQVPPEQTAIQTPALLITEVVPQSSGVGQPYEYVEIFNNTSEDIDLTNYQLQYFTSNMNSPANRWTITDKTIKAKSALVLWLKKFDYPHVPLWDFNSNYGVYLIPEQVFEVELTTSAQGLHDSALRKVGIAGPDGVPISTALINEGTRDGIENRSVLYQANGSEVNMTKISNNVIPTPGTLAHAQVPGPKMPVQLVATPGNQFVDLSWDSEDSEAVAFNVYYKGAGATGSITVTEQTYATVDSLTNHQEYHFRVTSLDAEGNESPATAEVIAFPQENVDVHAPAVPTGLTAHPGNGHVTLEWTSNSEPDLEGYRIFINGTLFTTVSADVQRWTVAPLENGREYTFTITAYDHVGNESSKSEPITAEPLQESVSIPRLLITEAVPDTHNFAGYDAFEYLELYNNSAEFIDLQGYRIRSGSWDVEITDSFKIAPWDTVLFWTRRAEIEPLTLEAFNSYYFSSYFSKYLPDERLKILGGIGGLVNSNNQTITVIDPNGLEVVKAHYSGDDVSELRAITFGYPQDGSIVMETLAGHQPVTPGWVVAGQVPSRPQQHTEAPQAPAHVQAVASAGQAEITWAANSEEDLYRYHIYKNGQLEFSVSAAEQQFTVYSLLGNQETTFELTAEDMSGNVSEKSTAVTVTPSHQLITQEERVIHSKDPKYSMLWEISKDGPVIPGLAQDLVPQGLGYDAENDWLLAIYYLDDKRPSTIAVIDATTEELVKAVVLYNEDGTPYTGHAGGITVSREHVWVASETFLYQMKLSDLVEAEDNEEVRFIEHIPVPVNAAYNVYADGVLWVGEFYEARSYPTDSSHHLVNRDGDLYYAWMAGYVLDEQTDSLTPEQWSENSGVSATPDMIFSTTEKVQGAVILEDQIILSTSYGRGNDSTLFRYNNPLSETQHTSVTVNGKEVPLWFLDRQAKPEQHSRLVFVPMSEGITTIGNQLYVMTEAGATKYRYTTTYPLDRLLIVDLEQWHNY